jgi:hypothetical protein
MRHRTFVLAGLVALVSAALLGAAPRARATTVSVQPPDTSVTVGDVFNVRIVTDAFPDLKGFEVIFSYDPTKVQLLGADPGDVLTSSGNPYSAFLVPDNTAPADSAWYDAAMLIGSTQGPGILDFFKFKALHEGDCPIQCQLVDFRDSDNNRTLPACQSGVVHILGPVPMVRTTWGRLKTHYR